MIFEPPQEKIPVLLAPGTETSMMIYSHLPQENSPVFVCLPALGISSKHYAHLARLLAAEFNAVAITTDLRGLGTSSVRAKRGVDFGYKELLEDIEHQLRIVKTKYPQSPVYLIGHSLGGQLACLYGAWGKTVISGIILVAACSIYYKGWPGLEGYKILAFTQTARLLSKVLGYFPGKKVGFRGTESRTVIEDWSHTARTGSYELKNTDFNFEQSLTKVKLPVLAVQIFGDRLAPSLAIENLCAKLKSAAVAKVVLGNPTDARKLNHFNWVKHPETLLKIIKNWMSEKH